MEIETKEQASETGETPVAVTPPEARKTRRRNIITFLVAAILNVGLLTLLATQLLTPAHQSVTQNGTPVSGDTLLGQMAPNFTLAALTMQGNQQISLSSYKGKPVVLNFWSSTCAPCQDEIPLLESQWERNQAKGVIFLGVDVEDTAVDGRLFLHQYGMTYPSVIDSNGMTLVSYGVTYTPETIFIDRSGRVVDAVRMEITSQQLQDGLAKILG